MRLLVYGMQSSGASTLAFMLGQKRGCGALVDIWSMYAAPRLTEPGDIIAKVVVTTAYPLAVHQARFRPDHTILLLRHPVANERSLSTKPYRDHCGLLEEKFQILEDVFANGSAYDTIIHYEDLVFDPPGALASIAAAGWSGVPAEPAPRRTHQDMVDFNQQHFPSLTGRLQYGLGQHRGEDVSAAYAGLYHLAADSRVAAWCPRIVTHYADLMASGRWASKERTSPSLAPAGPQPFRPAPPPRAAPDQAIPAPLCQPPETLTVPTSQAAGMRAGLAGGGARNKDSNTNGHPLVSGDPTTITHFERAVAIPPDDPQRLRSFADTLLTEGRLLEARIVNRQILNGTPADARAMAALGRIERRLGDASAALDHFRAAAEAVPGNRFVLNDLAGALADLDQPGHAAAIYNRILTADPEHAPSHLGLGWIARRAGDDPAAARHFAEAVGLLRSAVEADPHNLDTQALLATALRETDRLDEAEAIYRAILDQRPGHVSSHMGLGWLARARGTHEAALTHFAAAAHAGPGDVTAHLAAAGVLANLGRHEEAEAAYRRVIAQAPHHPQARSALADLARTKGDWSGALDHLRVAIEADPRSLRLRLRLGRALSDLSRWAEAEDVFQAILGDSPRDAEALIGLADAAKAQGDTERALSLYRDAAGIAPLDPRPRRELRREATLDGADDWRTEVNDAMEVAATTASAPEAQIEAAKTLVEYGLTEAAKPLLSRLQARFPVARQLVLAVRQMERMGLAVPVPNGRPHPDAADHQLEALRGVIEIPVAEADTLLLVFAGTNNRLWMTFSLLHKLLRKTQISIVYCRDLRRDWYASGVVGVGGDFASTVHGFRDLATAHGARRILTLGNCVGCGGALRFGLALGAQGVLGLGPKLQPNDALKPDQKASLASIRQLLPSGHKAARIRYREADSRPAVSLIYGERCGADAAEARSMADIPGIEATAIPESADPDSVKDLLVRGLLEPVLHDFVCHGRLSPELRARIASSRTPQS
jgi:tetratricopeptide (TPR) repeat protein